MAVRYPAQYFDGKTAASSDVEIELLADCIAFKDPAGATARWTYGGLEAATPVRSGQPLRLKHATATTARLSIPVGAAQSRIFERASHLQSGINTAKTVRFALLVAVGLICVLGAAYAALNFAPHQIAGLLPQDWRDRLADHAEKSFIKDAHQCTGIAGTKALSAIASRVAAVTVDTPDFSVRVFDMPFVNAFALPGGRIVLTSKLIKAADSPEEVAGVIAHELGHTAHLHPETSLVRAIGLQLLLSLVTGGAGGDTAGGIVGLLTILQYSRNAEREADRYAVSLLTKGGIDPKGLRYFFEKLDKSEFKILTGKLEELSGMLSTHPGTKERIEFIKPLAPGLAREVVPYKTWKQVKSICS